MALSICRDVGSCIEVDAGVDVTDTGDQPGRPHASVAALQGDMERKDEVTSVMQQPAALLLLIDRMPLYEPTLVLGVSPDPVARLGRFIEKQELNFTLLSDEDHAITEKYGCWGLKKFMGKEFMGVLRTTFIIGKDGRLKHVMDKVKTKSHHDDVIALIKDLGL